jgi:enamine deaminase RidA (YjgF/YER057c/UK114 family)
MTTSQHFRTVLVLSLAGTLAGCAAVPGKSGCVHRNAEIEQAIGYCEALRSGNELYISGVTGSGPMEAAVPRVYQALAEILKANGLTFRDVIKENVYTTDLDAFIANNGQRKPFLAEHAPAATWVEVQRLFRPNYVLEVELVARYPARR